MKLNLKPRRHIPNLIITQNICFINKDVEDPIIEEHIFEGDSAIDDFCLYLYQKPNHGAIICAHNNGGYKMVSRKF